MVTGIYKRGYLMRPIILLSIVALFSVQPAKAAVYIGTIFADAPRAQFATLGGTPGLDVTIVFDRAVNGNANFYYQYKRIEVILPEFLNVGGNEYFGAVSVDFNNQININLSDYLQTIIFYRDSLNNRDMASVRVRIPGYLYIELYDLTSPVSYTITMTAFSEPKPIIVAGAGVPEPSVWVMMIAGIGMIGAALRLARRWPKSFAAKVI